MSQFNPNILVIGKMGPCQRCKDFTGTVPDHNGLSYTCPYCEESMEVGARSAKIGEIRRATCWHCGGTFALQYDDPPESLAREE